MLLSSCLPRKGHHAVLDNAAASACCPACDHLHLLAQRSTHGSRWGFGAGKEPSAAKSAVDRPSGPAVAPPVHTPRGVPADAGSSGSSGGRLYAHRRGSRAICKPPWSTYAAVRVHPPGDRLQVPYVRSALSPSGVENRQVEPAEARPESSKALSRYGSCVAALSSAGRRLPRTPLDCTAMYVEVVLMPSW